MRHGCARRAAGCIGQGVSEDLGKGCEGNGWKGGAWWGGGWCAWKVREVEGERIIIGKMDGWWKGRIVERTTLKERSVSCSRRTHE